MIQQGCARFYIYRCSEFLEIAGKLNRLLSCTVRPLTTWNGPSDSQSVILSLAQALQPSHQEEQEKSAEREN